MVCVVTPGVDALVRLNPGASRGLAPRGLHAQNGHPPMEIGSVDIVAPQAEQGRHIGNLSG